MAAGLSQLQRIINYFHFGNANARLKNIYNTLFMYTIFILMSLFDKQVLHHQY